MIAPAGFMIGIESPDGKLIFYQENEQRHIWVSDPDGGSPRQLSQVTPTPDLDWTPVATSIYFASSIAASASSRRPRSDRRLDWLFSDAAKSGTKASGRSAASCR